MLDYTKFMDNSFRFILNYEVVDNNIIIHYAKEEDLVVPYSKDSEAFLLMLMRDQVTRAHDKIQKMKEKMDDNDNKLINIIGSFSLFYGLIERQILACLLAGGIFSFSTFQVYNYNKFKVILEDYEKSKFFVENEKEFEKINITINDLDKYSKGELIKAFERIDSDEVERVLIP